jgi:hypothetical protein
VNIDSFMSWVRTPKRGGLEVRENPLTFATIFIRVNRFVGGEHWACDASIDMAKVWRNNRAWRPIIAAEIRKLRTQLREAA